MIFHKTNSETAKQLKYIFLYGKTISPEMILRPEKHFRWTQHNLLLILLKTENNKKLFFSYYSLLKLLFICLIALFISRELCKRRWAIIIIIIIIKKKKKKLKRKMRKMWTWDTQMDLWWKYRSAVALLFPYPSTECPPHKEMKNLVNQTLNVHSFFFSS